MKRRVAAMIHVSRMLAVDAELFLRDRVGCQGVDGRALALCCEAGSEFGGWKLLEKVAKDNGGKFRKVTEKDMVGE